MPCLGMEGQVARGPATRGLLGSGEWPGSTRSEPEPEGLGERPWYTAIGNMDGPKGVAQSVCIFVSHLCPQRTSSQRTTGSQMARGQVSASHSPATFKVIPTPALQG